jgi:hypothetical protein
MRIENAMRLAEMLETNEARSAVEEACVVLAGALAEAVNRPANSDGKCKHIDEHRMAVGVDGGESLNEAEMAEGLGEVLKAAAEDDIDKAIERFCEKLTDAWHASHPSVNRNQVYFHAPTRGKKYTRVCYHFFGGDSAHCFVERSNGNLWKPASWKGPTKNFPRGNVHMENVTEFTGR